MKDKLTKNNHKGRYYRIRNILLGMVLFVSVSAFVVIPTYIGIKENNSSTHASEEYNDQNDVEQNDDGEEDDSSETVDESGYIIY